MTAAKPFPHWNDGSVPPPNEMLKERKPAMLTQKFIVDMGILGIGMEWFTRSKRTDGTWYEGYWGNGPKPVRWMQLPE